jgi:predicted nucleotide-binding protein (sugar kinase/HSP70/actin superfamily)
MKIGIPRALFYHYYPSLWESFVLALGMEPVLSSPTSTKTIELAAIVSETENCLPVKLLDAHIESLVGHVDVILVPRLLSMKKGRVSCPKLGALPDAAQANLRGRARILSVTVDANREPLDKTLTNLAVRLGIDRKRSKHAAQAAIKEMKQYRITLSADTPQGDQARILLLSHPYILHDDYLVGSVRRKLEDMNIDVYTLPFPESDKAPSLSAWDTCSSMHQTLLDLDPHDVAGVIHLSSFNCGCDSILVEFFREVLQDKKISYMVLVMDEHSAQSGVETRLEAFVDSIGW